VTHDFGIVARVCDRVAVMYAGKIVETAETIELFNHPKHPYTVALMNCLPREGVKVDKLYSIEGQPPDVRHLPQGCCFAPRCDKAMEICRQKYPEQSCVGENHYMNCWLGS
jgi:oligopeptide/dipeptide ABC transporter ATP-binding protein